MLAIAPLSRLKPPATVVQPHTEKISYLEIRQAYMGKYLQYGFFNDAKYICIFTHIYLYFIGIIVIVLKRYIKENI